MAPPKLDIQSLRTLLAIEKFGGVSRAADALELSQSGVSHKVRRLEVELNLEILRRKPNEPLFTEIGSNLLDYARRILEIHDGAVSALSKSDVHGQIRLGITHEALTSSLLQVLVRFRALHPGVFLRTQALLNAPLKEMVMAGDMDLVVIGVVEHEMLPTDIYLFSEEFHWVKSFDLRLQEGRPLPFLTFDGNCLYTKWVNEIYAANRIELETVLDCSSVAAIVAAVKAGLGITILGHQHLCRGVEVFAGELPKPPSFAYVLRLASNHKNPAICALAGEIQKIWSGQGSVPERTVEFSR